MTKLFVSVLVPGIFALAISAQDVPPGKTLYGQQCASCHGPALEGRSGPPLAGSDFGSRWSAADLRDKIKNTMPQDNPGKLTVSQAADLAAFIQEAGQTAGYAAPAIAGTAAEFLPTGNLSQLMRGIMFPNSNILFTVQTHDPGEKKKAGDATYNGGFNWAMWGNDLYSGWDIVDYAAIALAESAPLMLTPGRRCENGQPVPVNDPDWIRFTKEMAEVGKAAYRASQTRNQEKVSDITSDIADACLHCHQVFRDKVQRRGRGAGFDPNNKSLRCTK
jgi:cytochrome c553